MEIQANELRIGNWVKYGDLNVKSFSVDGLYNIITDIENYKPIPLTEEWLLRLGFDKYKDTNNFKIKSNKYFSLTEEKQGYLKIGISNNKWNIINFGNKSIFIKHVHQLQNLYFALTGKELIYKTT